MRIKHVLLLTAALLSGLTISARANTLSITDTSGVKRAIKIVKIGPVELYLAPPIPAVDSTPIREAIRLAKIAADKAIKDAIDEGLSKAKGDLSLKNYQNNRLLQSLLDETETSEYPVENIIATLDKALQGYKKVRDIKSQALIMNTYAVYYGRKSEMDKAIPFFQEALCLKELIKDKPGTIRIAATLASIYKVLGKYDAAIIYNEYIVRANAGIKTAKNQNAKIYSTIASLKALQQKYDESEYYIMKKALPSFQNPLDQNGRMNCFVNLADMYKLNNRNSEAKWYYLAAIALSEELNDKKTHVYCLVNLAQVKITIKDYELALSDYRIAEQLSIENNYKDVLVQIKGDVGDTYLKLGNYTAAGNALKEYTELKDTLLSTGN